MFEVFNTADGRTVTYREGTDAQALAYATALGASYDYLPADSGYYVRRVAGSRSDIIGRTFASRFDAQRRADMENMASDAYAFQVVPWRV